MGTSIFFDLDGTLWDASKSTANAWNEVFLRHKLFVEIDAEKIRAVAGRPYLDCLRILCPAAFDYQNFNLLLSDLAVREKSWMDRIGGELYPGVLEVIHQLSQSYNVFLVSNCNDWYLKSFLEKTNLNGVFTESLCHGNTGLSKEANLKFLIGKYKISSAFYVGDTEGDMEAATAAGMRYIHVSFGFGGGGMRNSFYVLNDLRKLPDIILKTAEI